MFCGGDVARLASLSIGLYSKAVNSKIKKRECISKVFMNYELLDHNSLR